MGAFLVTTFFETTFLAGTFFEIAFLAGVFAFAGAFLATVFLTVFTGFFGTLFFFAGAFFFVTIQLYDHTLYGYSRGWDYSNGI